MTGRKMIYAFKNQPQLPSAWLTFASPQTHQGFPLAQRVDRLQVGVAVQRVRVHAVLEGLHLLDDLLQRRVFDAHVVDGVQQGNPIRETLLHLLRRETLQKE